MIYLYCPFQLAVVTSEVLWSVSVSYLFIGLWTVSDCYLKDNLKKGIIISLTYNGIQRDLTEMKVPDCYKKKKKQLAANTILLKLPMFQNKANYQIPNLFFLALNSKAPKGNPPYLSSMFTWGGDGAVFVHWTGIQINPWDESNCSLTAETPRGMLDK